MSDLASMPSAPDAEIAVLQHCFARPNEAGEVLSQVPDGAFYHAGRRLIFETIGQMVGEGIPIEFNAASHYFEQQGLMDRIGGRGILAEITDSVGPAQWGYYRDILMDKWKAREVIEMCSEATTAAKAMPSDGNVDEWLGKLTERVLSLSLDRQQRREKPFVKLVDAALGRYEEAARRNGQIPGISTGFPGLDHVTGGKQPGQLWVIGGGTSDGKSAFAQQVALYMASHGTKTAIYTLEMPDEEVIDRFYAMHAQIDSSCFKRGFEKRWQVEHCNKANKELRALPVTIRDVSGIKLTPLIADMRVQAKRGVKHFVIDYGQLIEGELRNRSREEEVARVSRNLKAAAKQLRVSVDLLSQLNDDGKLRESRAMGFDADVVVTLSCPITKEKKDGEWVETRQEDKRILFLSKNRNGARSIPFSMRFNGPTFTFTEEAKP